MASKNNTYIGSRYVPIFVGEWDVKKSYEPLSIVTYQGNSFTSKTFVPVGVDISNGTYWICTANYNAQVEQYRQDVVNLRIDYGKMANSVNNVKTLGAKGDGVTDDTAAIKAAIREYGEVYFPEGVYIVRETIELENAAITLARNAILKAIDDITVVRIRKNGRICGGKVEAAIYGTTSPVIALYGEDMLGGSENCCVENVFIEGGVTNDGIHLCANPRPFVDGEECRSWVQFQMFKNLYIYKTNNAIHLEAKYTDNMKTATWVNANIFDCIDIEWCTRGIFCEGGGVPYECSGNSFTNIQLQWAAQYTTCAAKLAGELHTLDMFTWDVPENGKVVECNANNCNIKTNAYNYSKNVYDLGSNNRIYGEHIPTVVPPASACSKRAYNGEQDDCFYHIDKVETVTVSNGADPSPLFDGNFETGLSFDNLTTVDIAYGWPNTYIRFIGVAMKWNTYNGYIKVEISSDGSTFNTVYERDNLFTTLAYVDVPNIAAKVIRLTFKGCTIERIFGACSNPEAAYSRYLSSHNGRVYGDLFFENGAHAVLFGEDGFSYRLKVIDGALTVEKVN